MSDAIGYVRVSTEEQARENNSLPVQKKKIAAFCQQNGLELRMVFEDSDSGRTTQRPGFQQMLAYCRTHQGKISRMVVSDLSRLARNGLDQATTYALLQQVGTTVVSIDDPVTDNSAVGKLSRDMIGGHPTGSLQQLLE